MEGKGLGGFIITYNRSAQLLSTIQKVFDQSHPIDKLWIIDNSDNSKTKEAILSLRNEKIVYHRMGHNSGPAGGAKVGLELVAAEGYDWIYWGDDDDPPPFPYVFEDLIAMLQFEDSVKLGQVGIVGQKLNKNSGILQRISDNELQENPLLLVNNIAGNQCKIISRKAIEKGVFPDRELFFGFEELSFDLRLAREGFSSGVNGPFHYLLRQKYNKLGFKKDLIRKRSLQDLWRNYYSTRNLLYILLENKMYRALVYQFIRRLIKIPLAYKYGWKYGNLTLRTTIYGLIHFIIGSKGEFKGLRHEE